jgi:hypothetical protein
MADPTSFFTGWLVEPEHRAALLEKFPPRYATIVAHHVTLKFGDATAEPPAGVSAEIVGQADDGAGVQAMVVRIDGAISRPDGGTFHITWSLDPGREAGESNDVIAARGWTPIEPATPVRLTPKP